MAHVLTDPSSGLRLLARRRPSPVIALLLPGQPDDARGIEIECPEHVWGRRSGASAIERLHLGALGSAQRDTPSPTWRQDGSSLTCELALANDMRLMASAILEADGVRLAYVIANPTAIAYDEVQAVTCVKLLTDEFADPRLERGWVHHADGFDLLASEAPERLSLPLTSWLPCRYLVPFRWPVSGVRSERDGDITRHHKSRPVDEPFIATVSRDGAWIVATCTGETGNVWTNPERSCQHADPSTSIGPGAAARLELKTFAKRATLDEMLDLVRQRRQGWRTLAADSGR